MCVSTKLVTNDTSVESSIWRTSPAFLAGAVVPPRHMCHVVLLKSRVGWSVPGALSAVIWPIGVAGSIKEVQP
jgi:hypothetical protein